MCMHKWCGGVSPGAWGWGCLLGWRFTVSGFDWYPRPCSPVLWLSTCQLPACYLLLVVVWLNDCRTPAQIPSSISHASLCMDPFSELLYVSVCDHKCVPVYVSLCVPVCVADVGSRLQKGTGDRADVQMLIRLCVFQPPLFSFSPLSPFTSQMDLEHRAWVTDWQLLMRERDGKRTLRTGNSLIVISLSPLQGCLGP